MGCWEAPTTGDLIGVRIGGCFHPQMVVDHPVTAPLTNDAPRQRVNFRTTGSGVSVTIEVSKWKPPRELTLVCLDSSSSRANGVLSVQPRAKSLWLTWLCEVDSALNPFRSFVIARTTGRGSGQSSDCQALLITTARVV